MRVSLPDEFGGGLLAGVGACWCGGAGYCWGGGAPCNIELISFVSKSVNLLDIVVVGNDFGLVVVAAVVRPVVLVAFVSTISSL